MSEMMSLRWWKDTRSSRVSALTMRKLPSFRPTARALPSGEKQQQRPPAEENAFTAVRIFHFLPGNGSTPRSGGSPFRSLRTASMQWLGERSHMRRVLSSLTVAQRGRWGWLARPHTSPSMWPWRDTHGVVQMIAICLFLYFLFKKDIKKYQYSFKVGKKIDRLKYRDF